MNPWSHKIDYDAEIAKDEANVAWLSSDLCKKLAALVDERKALGETYLEAIDLCVKYPDVVPGLLGLTKQDVADWLVSQDYAGYGPSWNPELEAQLTATFGEGNFRRGNEIARRPCPDQGETEHLGHWRPCGEAGRVERLKKAKTDLSRHKRNKAKNA
jgi:hypothetical protein